jgi:hypothetical protein
MKYLKFMIILIPTYFIISNINIEPIFEEYGQEITVFSLYIFMIAITGKVTFILTKKAINYIEKQKIKDGPKFNTTIANSKKIENNQFVYYIFPLIIWFRFLHIDMGLSKETLSIIDTYIASVSYGICIGLFLVLLFRKRYVKVKQKD